MPARTGEIWFEGKRIDRLSPTERVLMGIAQVPEGRQVFGGLTVAENLRLGAYVHRRALSEAALAQRIARGVRAVPRPARAAWTTAVANLSGGQQQMLVIARGLMAKPRLLVLDEPSLGLAPVLVAEIFRLIAALRSEGGVSILLSEQNAKLSLAIADRAYVIESGRVALAGTGQELLELARSRRTLSRRRPRRQRRRRAKTCGAGGAAQGNFRRQMTPTQPSPSRGEGVLRRSLPLRGRVGVGG